MKTFTLEEALFEIKEYVIKEPQCHDLIFSGLSYDSRQVKKGDLFLCKGMAFKREYLNMAKEKGALAYLSEEDYHLSLPFIQVSSVRDVLAPLASFFYDHPEKEMDFIGITGTKGKTTTVYYLFSIFQEEALEKAGIDFPQGGYFSAALGKNAFLSTVKNFDGKTVTASSLTTPEPLELFSFLRKAKDQGAERVIMEVSSQALKYGRTKGLTFKHGAFLNISQDHISPVEHKDFEDYFSSKKKIFCQTEKAYINIDSPYEKEILEAARAGHEIISFSTKRKAVYQGKIVRNLEDGFVLEVDENSLKDKKLLQKEVFARDKKSAKDPSSFFLQIYSLGRFNAENALLAYAIGREEGIAKETIQRAFNRVHVDGRMELYSSSDGLIHIIVDYAHNRLSYERVVDEAHRLYPQAKIFSVSGTVGGKAENRRRDLGEICGAKTDLLYITSDDPGREDPLKIAQEIAEAVKSVGGSYHIEIDREKAISLALEEAEKRARQGEMTTLLFLGKGTDAYMFLPEGRVPMEADTIMASQWIKAYDMRS